MITKNKKGRYYGPETIFLLNSKTGAVFYTKQKDKDITAKAYYYGVKVKTERVLILSGNRTEPIFETLTKVTIL